MAKISNEFFEIIRSIGESRSKQEEDLIMENEVVFLKNRMSAREINSRQMKEYVIRALYCEMLGFEAEFSYIHAVNLTSSSKTLWEKAVGYLFASLCLDPGDQLNLLLVQPMLRDMQESNLLRNCIALTALRFLVSSETIPPLIGSVTKLLSHSSEIVRKKAVAALHSIFLVDPSSMESMISTVRRVFCDKHPSVMAATLGLFLDMAKSSVEENKDMIESFIHILTQIVDHKLPNEFDYHRVPAPWIQIYLLRILRVLGSSDPAASNKILPSIINVIRRVDIGTNISNAVIFECVRTASELEPNDELLSLCANHVSRFLSNDNPNIKYVGVKCLTCLVRVDAKYAALHQKKVIECLESTDQSLKRNTLDLLAEMTNPENVQVIVEKMIDYLRTSRDDVYNVELMSNICKLAESFSEDSFWFVRTLVTVFSLGTSLVNDEMIHRLLRLLAHGTGDPSSDPMLRAYAVDLLHRQIEIPALGDGLIKCIAWTLGEFGLLSRTLDSETIIEGLCDLADRRVSDTDTRSYVFTALVKLSFRLNQGKFSVDETVEELVDKFEDSKSVQIQQKCYELEKLVSIVDQSISQFFRSPPGYSYSEFKVDKKLSFLNGFVQQSLAAGQPSYQSVNLNDLFNSTERSRLLIKEYEAPRDPFSSSSGTTGNSEFSVGVGRQSNASVASTSSLFGSSSEAPSSEQSSWESSSAFKKSKNRRWGTAPSDTPATQSIPSTSGSSPTAPSSSSTSSSFSSPLQSLFTGTTSNTSSSSKTSSLSSSAGLAPKEEELSEESNALFSGVSSRASAGGKRGKRGKRGGRSSHGGDRSPVHVEQAPIETSSNLNIFESTETSGPSSSSVSHSSTSGGSFLDDLFGPSSAVSSAKDKPPSSSMSWSSVAPSSNSASSSSHSSFPPSATTSSAPLDDMFFDFGMKPSVQAPSSSSGSSSFSFLNDTQVPGDSNFGGSNSRLDPSRRLYSSNILLKSDEKVQVMYNYVLDSDATILLVFLTNLSVLEMTNVSISVQPPSHFETTSYFDPSPSSSSKSEAFFSLLRSRGQIALAIDMKIPHPPLSRSLDEFSGIVSFRDEMNVTHQLRFSSRMPSFLFLRENPASVSDFGSGWTSIPSEHAASTSLDGTVSMDGVVKAIARSIPGLSHIQTANDEALFMSHLLGHPSRVVYLYAKWERGLSKVGFKIKSKDDNFAERLKRSIEEVSLK